MSAGTSDSAAAPAVPGASCPGENSAKRREISISSDRGEAETLYRSSPPGKTPSGRAAEERNRPTVQSGSGKRAAALCPNMDSHPGFCSTPAARRKKTISLSGSFISLSSGSGSPESGTAAADSGGAAPAAVLQLCLASTVLKSCTAAHSPSGKPPGLQICRSGNSIAGTCRSILFIYSPPFASSKRQAKKNPADYHLLRPFPRGGE